MTDNTILAAAAVGIFGLLCIVTWHLVLTLRQTRQTALAAEQFLVALRPRVEAATEKLGSVIARTDGFLSSIEERGSSAGISGIIGHVLSGWATGIQAVSTISAAVAAIVQAWSMISRAGQTEEAPSSTGGANHG